MRNQEVSEGKKHFTQPSDLILYWKSRVLM